MSNFLDMFDSEKKEQVAALRDTLNDDKKRVSDELAYYKSIARDIKKAKKRIENAQAAYDKRESEKNASRLDGANEDLTAAMGSFEESEGQIRLLLDTIQVDYSNIADLYHGRKADRIMDAFEKYNNSVLSRIIDIQAYTETDNYFESEEEEETPMAIPEIPVAHGTPNPAAAPQQAAPAPAPANAYAHPAYAPYPQYIPVPMPMPYSCAPQQPAAPETNQTPNIAPVSIDVSPMLEKALEATMQKFVAAFDKRIEKFVNEHPVNIPASAPVAGASYASGEIASIEGAVLEDEQALVDKLNAIVENLKALSEAMDALNERCAEIAAKQNTANDMMKQTNDMQRQTVREQKGIQVSQRVINQDQAVVTQEQAALQDQQKALLESQQALVEGQQAMAEAHRLVAENQAAIDEAMKAAVVAQKEVISAQQAINASNAKALDVQNDVAEKQSATLALQKEALAAQRQMFRDQRSMVEKQKALGGESPKKKAKDDAEESAEAEAPAQEN